jgi:hypothetical protein
MLVELWKGLTTARQKLARNGNAEELNSRRVYTCGPFVKAEQLPCIVIPSFLYQSKGVSVECDIRFGACHDALTRQAGKDRSLRPASCRLRPH